MSYVSQEECNRTHEPMVEFKKETSDNFVRLHARIDKIYVAIFGVLLTIVAGIATNVMISRMSKDNQQQEIKIIIDRDALANAAKEGK